MLSKDHCFTRNEKAPSRIGARRNRRVSGGGGTDGKHRPDRRFIDDRAGADQVWPNYGE
jgi:hypothetical protein